MNKKIQILLMALIVLFAFILRTAWLNVMPVNLSNDEISIAYDAYSISKTLRDQHDHFLPVSFQSFNTYKAPLTIYLSIPFIKIFGNTNFAVRFPSAIFGSLTVLFLGMVVFEITKNKQLSLISSLVLAVTPWHVYTSRMALESNIALFFVVFGVYLFYKGLFITNRLFTIASVISFCLSMYSYHTEWVFTPLLFIALIVLNRKKIKDIRFYIFSFLSLIILSSPLFLDTLFNPSPTRRSSSEFFMNDPYVQQLLASPKYGIIQGTAIILKRIFDNYSQYLNIGLLFFNGLNLNFVVSDFRMIIDNPPIPVGLFLFGFLPFFLYGIVNIKKIFKDDYKFILTWALLSPLVPAFTLGGANFVRFLVAVAPFSIIIGGGLYFFWKLHKNITLKILIMLLIVGSFVYAALSYFQYGISSKYNYLYNYEEICTYIKKNYGDYDRIVMDAKFGDTYEYYGVPDLYMGYYDRINPISYLNKRTDERSVYFDKFQITTIIWEDEINRSRTLGKSLLISPISNQPTKAELDRFDLVNTVYFPNNSPSFYMYTLK